MMSLVNILIIASCLGMSHGYVCEWPGQESSILHKAIRNCPGVFDGPELSYCCIDTNQEFQCCNFFQFALTYIIIAIVVFAVLSILCSLICCCCCPSCCLYKRRRGNVV